MNTTAHHEPGDGRSSEGSLLEAVRGILRELPSLFSDRVELLSLELQRAGQALLQIVLLGMALVVLGITTWLILWCLIIIGLTLAGVSWLMVFVGVLAVHVLLGFWMVHRVQKLLPMLRLPATRRHLMFTSSPVPVTNPVTPTSPSETASF